MFVYVRLYVCISLYVCYSEYVICIRLYLYMSVSVSICRDYASVCRPYVCLYTLIAR